MLRSHRRLQLAHQFRLGRMRRLADGEAYVFNADRKYIEDIIRDLHRDGLIDQQTLFPEMLKVIVNICERVNAELDDGGLVWAIAERASASAFGDWTPEPRQRPSTGDVDLATARGCAAVGRIAVQERLVRAACEALRRRASTDHRLEPCWPDGHRERRAAEAARVSPSIPETPR